MLGSLLQHFPKKQLVYPILCLAEAIDQRYKGIFFLDTMQGTSRPSHEPMLPMLVSSHGVSPVPHVPVQWGTCVNLTTSLTYQMDDRSFAKSCSFVGSRYLLPENALDSKTEGQCLFLQESITTGNMFIFSRGLTEMEIHVPIDPRTMIYALSEFQFAPGERLPRAAQTRWGPARRDSERLGALRAVGAWRRRFKAGTKAAKTLPGFIGSGSEAHKPLAKSQWVVQL